MIRVMIADDHSIVRAGLKQILSETHDIKVAGEAESGSQALALLQKEEYDLIILDIKMPGRSGVETLKEIKAIKPRLPVLILSMHPEEQYAVRVLKAGASGYLTKGSAPDELIKAIRMIVKGRKYISPSIAEMLADNLETGDKLPHELLSDREYQVMCMLAEAKSVTDIADELALSPKTISTYRVRILEKMNLKTNAELTRYAIKKQLVD